MRLRLLVLAFLLVLLVGGLLSMSLLDFAAGAWIAAGAFLAMAGLRTLAWFGVLGGDDGAGDFDLDA